jgi:endonuclease/exonuclease/phosphatase family metal-dependent hydrolase
MESSWSRSFAALSIVGMACASDPDPDSAPGGTEVSTSGEDPTTGGTMDPPASSGELDDTTSTLPEITEGSFTVLTYNVAGLPEPLSGSMPATYTSMISPLLNAYDLVLVQEDFAYHEDLVSQADHPYQSEPMQPAAGDTIGDGLNRLSRHSFSDHQREAWRVCNGQLDSGSDCLTKKGFAFARHEIAPGVHLDVYNLHMDAGGSREDIEARAAQTQQLLDSIATHSAGAALIVAGDTNMRESSEAILQDLLEGAGLVDACRVLDCPEIDRIDRIMLRGSDGLALVPENWRLDESFVTRDGEPLSDHEAVAIDLHWTLL